MRQGQEKDHELELSKVQLKQSESMEKLKLEHLVALKSMKDDYD